jgi:hypothetical protein
MSWEGKPVKIHTVTLPGDNVYSFNETAKLGLENIKMSFLTVKPLRQRQLYDNDGANRGTSSTSTKRGPVMDWPMDAIKPPRSFAISALRCLICQN